MRLLTMIVLAPLAPFLLQLLSQLIDGYTYSCGQFIIPNTYLPVGPGFIPLLWLGVKLSRKCIRTKHGKRSFYTYVPDCAGENSPLVYDVHGYLGVPFANLLYTGWRELADEKCFVLVFPTGNINKLRTDEPCWAVPSGLNGLDPDPSMPTSQCCCDQRSTHVSPEDTEDLEFLHTVASYVVRDVPRSTDDRVTIDTRRIYFAGHSNGCMTALGMAMKHSDMVAAVCCHSGALLTPPSINYSPRPIWLVHGDRDGTLPYNGSVTFYGSELLPSQQGGYEYLYDLNGCNDTEMINFDGGFIQRSIGCTNDASVELITLHGVDHIPYTGFDTNLNTTKRAWDFCSSHQLTDFPLLPRI